MSEYTLPDEAVYEIEAWARRKNFTGGTVAEREEILDRIIGAIEEA